MEYQAIINVLFITAICGLTIVIFSILGIGIFTYKINKAFEKSQIEYNRIIEK